MAVTANAIAVLVLSIVAVVSAKRASLVLTTLCRDEAVNLKANLPAWLPIVDYFVFVLDSRTTDDSRNVISDILDQAGKPYVVVPNNFTGFGQARTLGLTAAWQHFSNATHVLITDPDWVPSSLTINLNELDDSADVFRFSINDAPRNGESTRRLMDWLLRHRQGLAMKYHLHEVLNIGPYTIKRVGWEMREVEKKGTWHTTVGHGTSISADRYRFDLQLLAKDLAQYGHDPHVHYYLGTTHQLYADKAAAQLGLRSPEVQDSIDQAIQYYTLRATSIYQDELLDQRWGALIGLGNIYTHLRRDDGLAVRWLSTCSVYNPNQAECAVLLAQLYRRLGQLKPALKLLDQVLATERGPDRASMQVDFWDCDVPALATDLLATQAQLQGLSPGEALHFFVLLEMTKTPHCSQKHTLAFNRAAKTAIQAPLNTPNTDFFALPASFFCAHTVLQQHLSARRYTLHPCKEYRLARERHLQCATFEATSPPAYEEFQLGSIGRQFIGAAMLPDIVHHAFQGYSGAFLAKGRTLRFLFAEHFHPEMVLNLLGQLQRQSVADFEIVVVSPVPATLKTITARMAFCLGQAQAGLSAKVKLLPMTLLAYAASVVEGIEFDYIEYNGGLSKAGDTLAELRALQALLRDGAVLGLTYFSRNYHVDQAHRLVDRRNATHMVPFSLEAARLVRYYLEQHKLDMFVHDAELVTHLGGEAVKSLYPLYKASDVQPRVQWRTYTQSEVEDLLGAQGFSVASWLPTAYSRPFEETTHYEVQKYRAFGISQERFVQDLMPTFRYSLYVVKGPLGSTLGRVKLSVDAFARNHTAPAAASALTVVDRLGNLAVSFQRMEQLAEQRRSTTIEIAHYAASGDLRVSIILAPVICPCLPQLSARRTVAELHEINRNFATKHQHDFDEVQTQSLLVALLSHLEKLNMITFEVSAASQSAGKRGRAFRVETIGERSGGFGGGGGGGGGRTDPGPGEQRTSGPAATSITRTPAAGDIPRGASVPTPKEQLTTSTSASTKPKAKVAGGETTAGSLSAQEQVSRMRSLGYTDEMIAQLLGASEHVVGSSAPKPSDTPASLPTKTEVSATVDADALTSGSSAPGPGGGVSTGSSAKAQEVIDLLKRFTQQRAAEAEAKAAARLTSDGASASVSLDAVRRSHIADSALSSAGSADTKATAPVTFKMAPGGGGLAGASGMLASGGLQLPASRSGSAKGGPTTSRPGQDSSSGGGGSRQAPSKSMQDTLPLRSEQISMPTLLTAAAITRSPRSLDCLSRSPPVGAQPQHCQEPKVLKRKTSQLVSTSARKLAFDQAQLAYVLAEPSVQLSAEAKPYLAAVRDSYRDIAKFLAEYSLDGQFKVVRLTSNSAVAQQAGYLNRALHIAADEGIPASQLVHDGAMRYLHSIRREVDAHDFLVVDVILQSAAMARIAGMLLTSTVWFDATNGAAFASHHDDGLVFRTIHTLVQQVALALSDATRRLAVSGYYTLAMDLRRASYSPVFMANKEDINVILWLTPEHPASEQPAVAGQDGLRIYDESAAGRLFSQGVSVYPSAHCDFLSRSSSLAIDLAARCNASHSEFVPRAPNRLVVVRSRKLCTLLTPGGGAAAEEGETDQAQGFKENTMIALVMVLTPSA